MMAGGNSRGKRSYGGSPFPDDSALSTHRVRSDVPHPLHPGNATIWVSSYLVPLFTWVYSFDVMLISTHCPIQGSSGCGDRTDDDHQVAGTTPCAGEGTR
jgi:hypothetical protein